MKLGAAAYCLAAVSSGSALVRACGGHDTPPREWSQEDLDHLEEKWGVDVSIYFPFFLSLFLSRLKRAHALWLEGSWPGRAGRFSLVCFPLPFM